MNLEKLENILKGEPKFRLKQAEKAVFIDLIEDWQETTTLPLELREKLNSLCPLEIKAEKIESKDKKTIKAVINLPDGLKVEAVLMMYENRNTVCVSSQVGCVFACAFCATGKMGFKRNLTIDEIIEQVLYFARLLAPSRPPANDWHCRAGSDSGPARRLKFMPSDDANMGITNIVFMGMGEPFLNYKNVLEAIMILNDQQGFGLGARHFSISTVGVVEGIKKLADEPLQLNLAISLHAPNDELRSKIMPVNKKYSIKKILQAVDDYIKKTNRKVMFEYIMIDGVNDSEKQARELAELMKKPLYFVNLIPCNPVGEFKPSLQKKIEKFKKILLESGVAVNQRYSFGQDISAACGQLAGVA